MSMIDNIEGSLMVGKEDITSILTTLAGISKDIEYIKERLDKRDDECSKHLAATKSNSNYIIGQAAVIAFLTFLATLTVKFWR